MTAAPTLLLGDVAVGDALPELGYDVTATTVVLGALASRDWRPMHHDYDFAVNRNGTQDIFLNTPNQAAWLGVFKKMSRVPLRLTAKSWSWCIGRQSREARAPSTTVVAVTS